MSGTSFAAAFFVVVCVSTGCHGGPEYRTRPAGEALMGSVQAGDVEAVREAIAAEPALVGYDGRQGFTPLHAAARAGNDRVIELLFDAGADVDAADAGGMRPLHIAVLNVHANSVRLLIDRGAQVDALGLDQVTALQLAAAGELLEIMDLLIESGADVDLQSREGFYGDFATALHVAAGRSRLESIARLLDAGASIDSRSKAEETPLHWAVGSNDGLEAFAGQGLRPDFARYGSGSAAAVALLLARGADANAQSWNGSTPLHLVFRGWTPDDMVEMVSLLLEAGADPNLRDSDGHTALSYAEMEKEGELEVGTREATALLRRHGAK